MNNECLADAPPVIQQMCRGVAIHDRTFGVSSARTYFFEKDGGYFLKTDAPGKLAREARMGEWLHARGLTPQVVAYEVGKRDFLLTERAAGENGIHPDHLAQPERLCDVQAEALRRLHEVDTVGCPEVEVTGRLAVRALERLAVDRDLLAYCDFVSQQEAEVYIRANQGMLVENVCQHGDICLPNIILKDFRFLAFVDLGLAGLADRHWDLFWGIWSLNYNLGTDRYRDRFLDAYGREDFDPARLKLCGAIAALND